jgi:phosphoglycolate phosphatase
MIGSVFRASRLPAKVIETWRRARVAATAIRGVLFDKDGTLFDFSASWRGAAEAVLAQATGGDREAAARIGQAIGYDVATRRFTPGSPLVAGSTRQVAAILSAHLPELDAAAFERLADAAAIAAEPTPATEDLPGFLAGLRAAGLALGVATHDSEGAARAHLESVGALDAFDFVAGYDSGHGLKPGPGMVLAFAEATALPPAALAMVGDSVHDLGAARAADAGLAVGVLTGPATRDILAPLADAVLDSIAELPALLGAAAQPASPAGGARAAES